jgi:hypothetical protein
MTRANKLGRWSKEEKRSGLWGFVNNFQQRGNAKKLNNCRMMPQLSAK